MDLMSDRDLRQPPFAVLLLMCWLVVVLQLLYMDWSTAARTMSDTDDAMRLVQLRSFLAGQGWFDLHEARLGPPAGYDSHWSRLIDAGLAGLFLALNLVVDTARAEFLMRIIWPLLWLVPVIAAAAAIAWRIGGREAALLLLLLTTVGMPAFQQFRPGRIDHHNIQIALALASLAAAAWGERTRAAAACGGLSGLALAIGLESLAFLVLAGAAMAVRYCVDRNTAPAVRAYGLALAASTLAGFLVSVGPDHWGRTACDAIAINWMEPVVAAGVMLALIGGVMPGRHVLTRWLAVAGVAGVSAAIFVALEPRCLGGPFAMVDPALYPVWMSHIQETKPLLSVLQSTPSTAAAILAFPATALIATVVLARDKDMRRNAGFLIAAAALLVSAVLIVVAVKSCNYAVWMGMPLVAAMLPRLFARFHLRSVGAQVAATIVLTPAVLAAGAIAVVQAAGVKAVTDNDRVVRGCFDSKSYVALARLPIGLIAADVDYGPFILALTPHAVLGAPYHRLPAGIMATHRIFTLPAEQARGEIEADRVDYLVTCLHNPSAGGAIAERVSGLGARLDAGDPPEWLEKLPAEADQVFTIHRVRRRDS